MRTILVYIITVLSLNVSAQAPTLSFNDYITIVKTSHPVMYRAQLLSDKAQANRKMARGGFDPKVEADWNHKSFDNKNYYSVSSAVVKVPTWYGVELKAGYNANSGLFLNNSDEIPSRGLWNAGLSVPLGKGLVIDRRRAELKKADVYQSVTEQGQVLMKNQLLYDASIAYLNWQSAQLFLNIAKEGVALSFTRLESTKQGYANGDKPAIDTLESFISLQNRQLEFQKAIQTFENRKLELNNFLWEEGEVPLDLVDNIIPEELNVDLLANQSDSLSIIQTQWLSIHPDLLIYDYKQAEIMIDQRLAKEELKPDIRLDYNPLIAVADNSLFDQFNPSNYKVGATVSYPILQRKERGKIQLNKIKLEDTQYKKTIKSQEIEVKLNTYKNNIAQTQNQYNLLSKTVDNYRRILAAENRKFDVGESSIFLINSREVKFLDSQYKLTETTKNLIQYRMVYLLFAAKIQDVI